MGGANRAIESLSHSDRDAEAARAFDGLVG